MVSFGIFRILDLLFFSGFHGNVSEMGQIFRFWSKTLKPFNNSQPNFTAVLIRSCSGAFWHLEIFRKSLFFLVSMERSLIMSVFRFRSKTPKLLTIFQQNFTDVLIRSRRGAFCHLDSLRIVNFPIFHRNMSRMQCVLSFIH